MTDIAPRQRPYVADQTFLPAALEILETPPSPVRMALLILICGFVSIAVLWASVGRLDVVSAAHGKISPIGKVKIVQPLQTGKVASIGATNGDRVVAGQVLASLDDRDAQAQLADQLQALAAVRAEIARREAAVAAADALLLQQVPGELSLPEWDSRIPPDIATREARVLQADVDHLLSMLASLEAQLDQRATEQIGLLATIARQEEYVQSLRDRVEMREVLFDKESGSRAELLEATGNLKAQEVTLSEEQGQLATSKAASEILARDWTKAKREFIEENLQKLADAAAQADALAQRVRQAELAVEQMALHSPIEGIVQAATLTSIGQVVTTGEEVMRIVPVDAPIEIEAYLPDTDIGFVRVGQTAVVKVDAFPFTRYGTIEGTVTAIGSDAIASADATRLQENSATALQSQQSGSAAQSNGLVFPIVVTLQRSSITADGTEVALVSGMGVTVEVDTGSRTILEYLFSPLVETAGAAMRER